MISKILDVFKDRVTYHDWIDDKTTEGIIDKVVCFQIANIIGFHFSMQLLKWRSKWLITHLMRDGFLKLQYNYTVYNYREMFYEQCFS